MDKDALKLFTFKTMRSEHQTQELLNLCNNDLEKLKEYEYKSKNNFLNYCASNIDEFNEVLNLKVKKEYWSFENGYK